MDKNIIDIPDFSLVVLIGGTGSGKSYFAHKNFENYEIVSSDDFRLKVSNNENQISNSEAFDLMFELVKIRLSKKLLTVIDATHLNEADRKNIITLAKKYYALTVAIIMDTPLENCKLNNSIRANPRPEQVVINHHKILKKQYIKADGFNYIYTVKSSDNTSVKRIPLKIDKKDDHGPFDIIGDIHGCLTELKLLLTEQGYIISEFEGRYRNHYTISHPDGRKPVFVGDLCDRGPDNPGVLFFVMDVVLANQGYCVKGNHDHRLEEYLKGNEVTHTYGFQETINQIELLIQNGMEKRNIYNDFTKFLSKITSYLLLDDGKLVVSHTGIRSDMIGGAGTLVYQTCIFGDHKTTGKGKAAWCYEYNGDPCVVYGHLSVQDAIWIGKTLCVDTGCVYGGKLTALKWPEKEIVNVNAKEPYYPGILSELKPLESQTLWNEDITGDELLNMRGIALEDGFIKSDPTLISQAFENITRFSNISRFIYVPPTTATAGGKIIDGCLEHPIHAIEAFKRCGYSKIYGQEKHMGSRCIIFIARTKDMTMSMCGESTYGFATSKTGKNFFQDKETETRFIETLKHDIDNSGLWDILGNWMILDGEMLPWSYKAKKLIENTFLSSALSLKSKSELELSQINKAIHLCPELIDIKEKIKSNVDNARNFMAECKNYLTPFNNFNDFRYAPFHILVSEKTEGYNQSHDWHINTLNLIESNVLTSTRHIAIDLNNPQDINESIKLWEDIVKSGKEGMIFKAPTLNTKDNISAIKVRGPEYLMLVYGADYRNNIVSLSKRNLKRKRLLSVKGNQISIEALKQTYKGNMKEAFMCNMLAYSLYFETIDERL